MFMSVLRVKNVPILTLVQAKLDNVREASETSVGITGSSIKHQIGAFLRQLHKNCYLLCAMNFVTLACHPYRTCSSCVLRKSVSCLLLLDAGSHWMPRFCARLWERDTTMDEVVAYCWHNSDKILFTA